MQLFGLAGILNLFCVIVSDGVKSVVGWVSMFGGLLVFLSGVYAVGFISGIPFCDCCSVGLGPTGHLPYHGTILLVQSKATDSKELASECSQEKIQGLGSLMRKRNLGILG